jgi:hypothetical protein
MLSKEFQGEEKDVGNKNVWCHGRRRVKSLKGKNKYTCTLLFIKDTEESDVVQK